MHQKIKVVNKISKVCSKMLCTVFSMVIVTRNNIVIVWKLVRSYCLCYCKTFSFFFFFILIFKNFIQNETLSLVIKITKHIQINI